MRIVLATQNRHKLAELTALLEGTGIEALCLDDIGQFPDIPEDHDTFEDNALQKAR